MMLVSPACVWRGRGVGWGGGGEVQVCSPCYEKEVLDHYRCSCKAS